MKIRSISGLTCYVKDLTRTISFYKALGFEFRKRGDDYATGYSNWFWINFIQKAEQATGGVGISVYLSVDDVDAAYADAREAGLHLEGEPVNTVYGSREFTLVDPDGYRLAIFKRK